MVPRLLGLHHVTATVDDAQVDLDFAVATLGLRLVKKTVNFDNHNVYHFYYGTERGLPGTIWTTFPYRGQGVRAGRRGAGQVSATAFSVPRGALGAWRDRFAAHGVAARAGAPRFGEESLTFGDASGLAFELVESADDARAPWAEGGVEAGAAIRGVHSVTLAVPALDPTLEMMTRLLGFEVVGEGDGRTRVAAGGRGPGQIVDVVASPSPAGQNGLGTVHHVAFAIGSAEEQLDVREQLLSHGLRVTPVMDRCYFHSIYFREPGGVLFEVATVAPGFTADESLSSLGGGLKLPPWEEPHRAAIEAALPLVTRPVAGAVAAAPGGAGPA